MVFEGFLKTGSTTKLAQALARRGVKTKRGRIITKGEIYRLLNNRVYRGDAVHKGIAYPGEHDLTDAKRY